MTRSIGGHSAVTSPAMQFGKISKKGIMPAVGAALLGTVLSGPSQADKVDECYAAGNIPVWGYISETTKPVKPYGAKQTPVRSETNGEEYKIPTFRQENGNYSFQVDPEAMENLGLALRPILYNPDDKFEQKLNAQLVATQLGNMDINMRRDAKAVADEYGRVAQSWRVKFSEAGPWAGADLGRITMQGQDVMALGDLPSEKWFTDQSQTLHPYVNGKKWDGKKIPKSWTKNDKGILGFLLDKSHTWLFGQGSLRQGEDIAYQGKAVRTLEQDYNNESVLCFQAKPDPVAVDYLQKGKTVGQYNAYKKKHPN